MRFEKHIVKKQKRKRRFETVLSIFILLAIFLGGVTGYYSSKVMGFLDGISVETEESEEDMLKYKKQLDELEPFSAVILGLDVEDGGNSRSDTIIVLTVNPQSEDIKMVSIPRDTLITLPDGLTEKINAAHSSGGARMARDVIGDYLDIDIDFYATMDFNGLVELVDAVGGVNVDSDLAFSQSDYKNPGQSVKIVEGEQHLMGNEALAYARMRKVDPRGDFGRQDRQQQVIIGVLEQLISFNSFTNINGILRAIQPYLKTNATPYNMFAIAANYSNAAKNIDRLALEGYADTTFFPHYGHEVYSWHAYESSLFEVQNELKKHLGLEISEDEYYEDGYYEDEYYEEEIYEEEIYDPELGY